MLRSTHKPSAAATALLAPGWTEHKAPSGHTYYYNAATKKSTYQRPVELAPPAPVSLDPSQSFLQYQNVTLGRQPSGPGFIPYGPNGVPIGHQPFGAPGPSGQSFGVGLQVHQNRQQQPYRPKPQPTDKPRSKCPIPGHDNWFVIETKLQRRFVYNSAKNESYWRIPEKLKQPILEMDQARIKEKAAAWAKEQEDRSEQAEGPSQRPSEVEREEPKERLDVPEGEASDEYEEVEVTDDEGAEESEQAAKRPRTEAEAHDEPVEFTEEDIAYQLAALGQDYGLEPDEYGAEGDYAEEYDEGLEFSEEDAVALFKDLLNDSGVSPFMDWERVVEEGKLVNDGRYTSLTTMKKRKEVWDEWTVEKIAKIKEQRAREEKKDPRIPFLTYLQRNANPKLYWPEFRRKFRKDNEMKASDLTDKEREKMYREHVSRLKMPQSTLKSDFLNLLKSQPISVLNNKTTMQSLPQQILSDIKFYSLEDKARDTLVEQYISTLPPPPDKVEKEESEEVKKERSERERREKALAARERRVAEEKRRQERNLAFRKGRMREEEEQIERAMNVGKGGLKGHLMKMDVDPKEGEKDV